MSKKISSLQYCDCLAFGSIGCIGCYESKAKIIKLNKQLEIYRKALEVIGDNEITLHTVNVILCAKIAKQALADGDKI